MVKPTAAEWPPNDYLLFAVLSKAPEPASDQAHSQTSPLEPTLGSSPLVPGFARSSQLGPAIDLREINQSACYMVEIVHEDVKDDICDDLHDLAVS
jgi:hypothetical protein